MTAANTGKKHSEATKAKMRLRLTSDETRKKMSESAKLRGAPLVALANSLAANKGKKRGPYGAERVAKAAAGIKAAWSDPVKRERLVAARKKAWETRHTLKLKE